MPASTTEIVLRKSSNWNMWSQHQQVKNPEVSEVNL